MKAKPWKKISGGFEPCKPEEATHVEINRPGPMGAAMLPVRLSGPRANTPEWTWNGSVDAPTLKPSIKSVYDSKASKVICHSWVTDGKIKFLDDCTHELAGETVDLFEVDD